MNAEEIVTGRLALLGGECVFTVSRIATAGTVRGAPDAGQCAMGAYPDLQSAMTLQNRVI